jgi:FkbM family methyltransferase
MTAQSKTPLFKKIPMTRVRLGLARLLYFLFHTILRQDKQIIRRKGVFYEVDLTEGIDLSLYIFGNFQDYVTRNKYFSIPADAVVIDVGANIGSMTFKFAGIAPEGHVYAFEPTDYAYAKLLKNISLNPQFASRITPVQCFLADQNRLKHEMKAYASWKVDGSNPNPHPLHGGAIKPADSIPAVTMDHFFLENGIQRVDLVKIDTDGYEYKVLNGARKTIKKYRPYVVFEIGGYVLNEQQLEFEQFHDYFENFGYRLLNAKNGKKITVQNFANQIPLRATSDIIAIPPNFLKNLR